MTSAPTRWQVPRPAATQRRLRTEPHATCSRDHSLPSNVRAGAMIANGHRSIQHGITPQTFHVKDCGPIRRLIAAIAGDYGKSRIVYEPHERSSSPQKAYEMGRNIEKPFIVELCRGVTGGADDEGSWTWMAISARHPRECQSVAESPTDQQPETEWPQSLSPPDATAVS